MGTFIATTAVVTGVLAMLTLPLLAAAWWADRIKVAYGFLVSAGIIGVIYGFFAIASESACEADSMGACTGARMGVAFLMGFVMLVYAAVAVVAAVVMAFLATGKPKGTVEEWMWCDDCVDLVETADHPNDHPMRPLRKN